MVDFIYTQLINGSEEERKMTVPFLTLIPIPFIEITRITIDFNVKLNSVFSR
jgi:hypothetical protein